MTPRQSLCYKFVQKYWGEHGVAPTYNEIAEHMGVKNRSTVNRLVNSMVQRGLFEHEPKLARSVRPANMEWPPA